MMYDRYQVEFMARGISDVSPVYDGDFISSNITVQVSMFPDNNNTKFICEAIRDFCTVEMSDPATVFFVG